MSIQLTEREFQFIATAFQCMDGKPNIDFAKFASITGLKGAKSARDSFNPLMKKLMAHGAKLNTATSSDGDKTGDSGDNEDTTVKSTPKPGKGGRKRKVADDADFKPARKARKPKVKKEESEDEPDIHDADENVPVKHERASDDSGAAPLDAVDVDEQDDEKDFD